MPLLASVTQLQREREIAFGRYRAFFTLRAVTLPLKSISVSIMEENAELLALQRLDETSAQLQKQGNYLEALECMERGLVLRQHFFGSDSEEVCHLALRSAR